MRPPYALLAVIRRSSGPEYRTRSRASLSSPQARPPRRAPPSVGFIRAVRYWARDFFETAWPSSRGAPRRRAHALREQNDQDDDKYQGAWHDVHGSSFPATQLAQHTAFNKGAEVPLDARFALGRATRGAVFVRRAARRSIARNGPKSGIGTSGVPFSTVPPEESGAQHRTEATDGCIRAGASTGHSNPH